jgi:hypothetical protein
MLDSAYHSLLIQTAITSAKADGPKHSIASIKEALFIFLLDILNRMPQQSFFIQPELERISRRDHTKDHHNHRRPVWKGSQTTNRNNEAPPPSSPPPVTQISEPSTLQLPDKHTPIPADNPPLTSGVESASRPMTLKLPPTPPAPSLPATPDPRTPTPDPFFNLPDREELYRQLESTFREDIKCENLLRATPEQEEETAALSNGNSKIKQPTGQGQDWKLAPHTHTPQDLPGLERLP